MLEWILAALGTAGGLLWWSKAVAAQKGGNLWRSAFPGVAHEFTANALELLDFKPFTLKMGKHTYGLYLSPAGLNDNDVQSVLATPAGANGPVTAVMRHRTNIPIPGPTVVPVNADLWMVESIYTGPDKTVSPDTVAAAATGNAPLLIPANKQLGAILYSAALSPTLPGRLMFIPIGAKQR